MQLTNEVLEKAVKSGLEVLGPESDISIPAKHNEGIFYLRAILTSLVKGESMIAPAQKKEPPKAPPVKKPVAEGVGRAVREGQVVDGEAEEVSSND